MRDEYGSYTRHAFEWMPWFVMETRGFMTNESVRRYFEDELEEGEIRD